MQRLALVVLAASIFLACQRKEEVVVAAPAGPSAPAQAPAMAPAAAPGAELPPGHPPIGQGGEGSAEGGAMAAPPPAHGGAMSAGADVGAVKVERATGADARTIAEVFAQKAALAGKTVTVRGKVVKYNPGIMGKNWIHLRDGTGTSGKDNDVTVTSQDATKLGEVVTVRGKVAVDQDIGMGTPYPVIIEDAQVTR
ncbi:MAG TPA: hypothetical protein VFG59_07855 [Anaeromyxobacter sp.]|nr:hypothetical protein [Anaeromyxobacter sp.]